MLSVLSHRMIKGEIVQPEGFLGGEEGRQVFPAVCLQNEGDRVEIHEVSWTAWPCPHSSMQVCPWCDLILNARED